MSGAPPARRVAKRPPEISFGGRVLFLADDAELIRRQLHDGLDPELTPDLKARLRDQISTDEITPAYICFFYDETLGDFPYLGLEVASVRTEEPRPPLSAAWSGRAASSARSRGSGAGRGRAGNRAPTPS